MIAYRVPSQLPLRMAGAALGGSLSAVVAVATYWLGGELFTWIAAAGVLIGAVLGYASAPGAVTTDQPVVFALRRAVAAVAIGLAGYFAMLAGGRLWSVPSLDTIAGGTLLVTMVVGVAFALTLPMAVPIGLIAVGLLRRGMQLDSGTATRLLLLLVAVTVAAGALTVADFQATRAKREAGVSEIDADHWLSLATAPVRLAWTVTNRSASDLVMELSTSGARYERETQRRTEHGLPACRVSAGITALDARWALRVEPDNPRVPDNAAGFTLPEVVIAHEAPGRDPTVSIEVAPDGSATVTQGRGLPTDEELRQPLC